MTTYSDRNPDQQFTPEELVQIKQMAQSRIFPKAMIINGQYVDHAMRSQLPGLYEALRSYYDSDGEVDFVIDNLEESGVW